MRAMALTTSDLAALDRAIAAGELEVEYDGMRRRMRSIQDLLQARAHVAAVLSAAAGEASAHRAPVVYQPTFTTLRGD